MVTPIEQLFKVLELPATLHAKVRLDGKRCVGLALDKPAIQQKLDALRLFGGECQHGKLVSSVRQIKRAVQRTKVSAVDNSRIKQMNASNDGWIIGCNGLSGWAHGRR